MLWDKAASDLLVMMKRGVRFVPRRRGGAGALGPRLREGDISAWAAFGQPRFEPVGDR